MVILIFFFLSFIYNIGMRIMLVFIFTGMLALSAIADIDPSTGSFILEHTDLKTNEALTSLEIKRYYNHKIKNGGIFGKNWCSNLDERLVHQNGVILITRCKQVTGQVFTKVTDYFSTASGAEVIKVLPKNSGYFRITSDRVYSYNENGQLAAIALKKSFAEPYMRLFFNKKGLISKIVHNDKYHYLFDFEPVEKIVKSITGPGNIKLSYAYNGNSYLVSATSAWNKTINYNYDDLNRLNSTGLGGKNSQVKYDAQNFVQSITDTGNCTSKLLYKLNLAGQRIETNIESSCGPAVSYATDKSPVFFKNRKNTSQGYRKPAALSSPLIDLKIGWKNVTDGGHSWDYFEDKLGLITEIRLRDSATKKIRKLKIKYEQQRVSEIRLDDQGGIKFIYNQSVFANMLYLDRAGKSNETLGLYARFIAAAARNMNVEKL